MRRNGLHVTALRNQSTKKRERERPAVHFKMSNLDYSNGGIVTGVTGDTFSPSPSPPPRSNFGEAVVALSSPLPACLFITALYSARGKKKTPAGRRHLEVNAGDTVAPGPVALSV